MDGTPRTALSRAEVGARLSALLIDLMLLGLAAVVAMFGTVMASAPFWQVNGHTNGTGGGGGSAVLALNESVPAWVSWVVVGILAGAAVVLSGSFSRPGSRRSFGLKFAELCLARATATSTSTDEDDDAQGPRRPLGPRRLEPSRWRVAARWVIPLATFAVLVTLTSGFLATLVTVGCWAPALFGSRRSVYDRLAGVQSSSTRSGPSVAPGCGQSTTTGVERRPLSRRHPLESRETGRCPVPDRPVSQHSAQMVLAATALQSHPEVG